MPIPYAEPLGRDSPTVSFSPTAAATFAEMWVKICPVGEGQGVRGKGWHEICVFETYCISPNARAERYGSWYIQKTGLSLPG